MHASLANNADALRETLRDNHATGYTGALLFVVQLQRGEAIRKPFRGAVFARLSMSGVTPVICCGMAYCPNSVRRQMFNVPQIDS